MKDVLNAQEPRNRDGRKKLLAPFSPFSTFRVRHEFT
jgi:hypothetical protein